MRTGLMPMGFTACRVSWHGCDATGKGPVEGRGYVEFQYDHALVERLETWHGHAVTADPSPHIAILLATHNGDRFLEPQLNSFLEQTHQNWSLWISDDGSTDETRVVVKRWMDAHPECEVHLQDGPRRGAAQNFLSLMLNADIIADYFCFSDQDDVWFPEKLAQAVQHAPAPNDMTPFLYGARTVVTDADLTVRGTSALHRGAFDFANALVQNFAPGNTMLLNNAARALVPSSVANHDITAFDWTMYQLVTATGGVVHYDTEPCLYYRQHDRNEFGDNFGLGAKWARLRAVANGQFRRWNESNLAALKDVEPSILPENLKTLRSFEAVTMKRFFGAVRLMKQAGLHRHSRTETLGLYIAAFFGRI